MKNYIIKLIMKMPDYGSEAYKQLADFVCLCRYQTNRPSAKSPTFLSLPIISSLVGCSTSSIRNICIWQCQDVQTLNQIDSYIARSSLNLLAKKRDRRRKVTVALRKAATCENTLRKMAGKTLTERCVLLHRMMPDIRIKRTTLSKLYKDNGIKKKVIKKVKRVPQSS